MQINRENLKKIIPTLAKHLGCIPQIEHSVKSLESLMKMVTSSNKNGIQLSFRQHNILTKGMAFLLSFNSFRTLYLNTKVFNIFESMIKEGQRDVPIQGQYKLALTETINLLLSAAKLWLKKKNESKNPSNQAGAPAPQTPIPKPHSYQIPQRGGDLVGSQQKTIQQQEINQCVTTQLMTHQINQQYQIPPTIQQQLDALNITIQQLSTKKKQAPINQLILRPKMEKTKQMKIDNFFKPSIQVGPEMTQPKFNPPLQPKAETQPQPQTQPYNPRQEWRDYIRQKQQLIEDIPPSSMRQLSIRIFDKLTAISGKNPRIVNEILGIWLRFVNNYLQISPKPAALTLLDNQDIFLPFIGFQFEEMTQKLEFNDDTPNTILLINKIMDLEVEEWKQLCLELKEKEEHLLATKQRHLYRGRVGYEASSEDDEEQWEDVSDDHSHDGDNLE